MYLEERNHRDDLNHKMMILFPTYHKEKRYIIEFILYLVYHTTTTPFFITTL